MNFKHENLSELRDGEEYLLNKQLIRDIQLQLDFDSFNLTEN